MYPASRTGRRVAASGIGAVCREPDGRNHTGYDLNASRDDVVSSADPQGVTRARLAGPFRKVPEFCWHASLDDLPYSAALAAIADDEAFPKRSTFWVHEDGRPLGPAHSPHKRIRDEGGGAFSHWRTAIYFSTSDGSDPNTNGRTYELIVRDPPAEAVPPKAEKAGKNDLALGLRARHFLLQGLLQSSSANSGGEKDTGQLRQEVARLEREIVAESGRFDEAFYRRSYGGLIPPGCSALDHFMETGWREGLLASPTFDPIVYKILRPLRRHQNPLLDSILMNDTAEYRDVASLFSDLGLDQVEMTIRYASRIRAEWTANASTIVENRDRSAHIGSGDVRYELRNPTPQAVLSRFAENKPFCFARLPHGFWDDFASCHGVSETLRADSRCRSLNKEELFNLSGRLLSSSRMDTTNQCYEGFFSEIERDLLDNPRDEAFWTAISLKGLPTFDDDMYGFDEADVAERIATLRRFFAPTDVLYDAMLWKRWVVSGDMARLPDAVRDHPVIVLGPPQFRPLRRKWRLSSFRHVEIPEDFSHLVRQRMLTSLEKVIEAARLERNERHPVVLFQCSGELSYWLMRRLRPVYPDVFYLDIGQALDLWQWRPEQAWASIYSDAIRSANPLIDEHIDEELQADDTDVVTVNSTDEAKEMLRLEYRDTGLIQIGRTEPLYALSSVFLREGALGWSATVPPEFAPLTDTTSAPRSSPLLLLEDGKPLGRGHDEHVRIFDEGSGRYSFWKGGLYFSTSDNSDPNTNGRKYEIGGRIDLLPRKQ